MRTPMPDHAAARAGARQLRDGGRARSGRIGGLSGRPEEGVVSLVMSVDERQQFLAGPSPIFAQQLENGLNAGLDPGNSAVYLGEAVFHASEAVFHAAES
jgi:hypothetical protein